MQNKEEQTKHESKNPKKMSNKKLVILLLILVVLLALIPLFYLKGASFQGSDNAGTSMIQTIDPKYKPWFTPIMEKLIGGALPSEVEGLFFSIQTGIGVGIIAFIMGRFVERKKWTDKEKQANDSVKDVSSKDANPIKGDIEKKTERKED